MSTFQLLDLETLVAAMVADTVALTGKITDFTEGSVIRSLLEASALEMQRLNLFIYQGVREGIETGTYKNFSFGRLPSVVASGVVRFGRLASLQAEVIPAGTRVQVPGAAQKTYQTLTDATMGVGVESVLVPVRCSTPGQAGNTPQNTVVQLLTTLPFVASVTNPQAFLNGMEQESEENRRDRFRQYIAGLSKGTKVALSAGARGVYISDAFGNAVERVTGVLVREPFRDDDPPGPIGRVVLYVDNGSGSTSSELLQAVKDVILGTETSLGVITPGWIAAGVEVSIKAVSAVPIDVVATVKLQTGFDGDAVVAEVEKALTVVLQGLQVFQPLVFAELVAAAMDVDGVADVTFGTPTENVSVLFDRRIVPGVISVTA